MRKDDDKFAGQADKITKEENNNLRNIGEGSSQVVAYRVNIIPLLFRHGRANVVCEHLSLVEEPLEDEQWSYKFSMISH